LAFLALQGGLLPDDVNLEPGELDYDRRRLRNFVPVVLDFVGVKNPIDPDPDFWLCHVKPDQRPARAEVRE
jgi:hypothetical protein